MFPCKILLGCLNHVGGRPDNLLLPQKPIKRKLGRQGERLRTKNPTSGRIMKPDCFKNCCFYSLRGREASASSCTDRRPASCSIQKQTGGGKNRTINAGVQTMYLKIIPFYSAHKTGQVLILVRINPSHPGVAKKRNHIRIALYYFAEPPIRGKLPCGSARGSGAVF